MFALAWWTSRSAGPRRATAADPAVASLLYAPHAPGAPALLDAWLDLVADVEARADERVLFETLDRSRVADGDHERERRAGVRALPAVLLHEPGAAAPRVWQGSALDLREVRAHVERLVADSAPPAVPVGWS